ncbi:uncharacterized protein N7518_002236 [Penicillium psychrosexuale]|uniref:uncharacterized protein n=1 Tax=Penicillium psychrosexuale TaxID=1002107 RepID=UPI002545156D|nr:uncharacterized protein N7518_002236 [Penicillium psychrosexuale]KAJ5800168.1 hypothetical protein N7518_002236 [Penicillium psychrosexuale]
MECFRQIFRCLKAPFKRDKGRIIEIGPPTNFRKEELPAYFSDAESVLSPSQDPAERSNLTNQSQDAYVRGQPHSDRGEGRNNDRDAIATIVNEEQDAGPCSKNERETIRERWKSSPAADHETKAPAESIKMEEMRNAELACS